MTYLDVRVREGVVLKHEVFDFGVRGLPGPGHDPPALEQKRLVDGDVLRYTRLQRLQHVSFHRR